MIPTKFDFPDHYGMDGLSPLPLTLKYESGAFVDLTGSVVNMQLKFANGNLAYNFSSTLTGEHKLTILPNGVVQFPTIKKWALAPGVYDYDLQVTNSVGFLKTYIFGTWTFRKGVLISQTY
jgi:hypothetical protein